MTNDKSILDMGILNTLENALQIILYSFLQNMWVPILTRFIKI